MKRLHILIILVLAAGYIVACSSTPKFNPPPQFAPAVAAPPVEPAASATVTAVAAIQPPLASAQQIAPTLTAANVDAQRPILTNWLAKAWDATATALASARATDDKARTADAASAKLISDVADRDKALKDSAATIAAANKKIADDQAKIKEIQDSFARWILGAAIFVCLGVCGWGGYLCFKADLAGGLPLIGGGAVGVAIAILALTLEHFFYEYEKPIGIGVCISGAGLLGFGVWYAYEKLHAGAVSAAKANAVAAAIGPVGGAAPIAAILHTPLMKKIAASVTPKPDLASPLNNPMNMAGIASPKVAG